VNESDTNALPDPELNPLLNPLLAAHMGRWAEVYFTTPPEKRGQAISELLQELKNIPSSEPLSVEMSNAGKAEQQAEIPGAVEPSDSEETIVTCGNCAYDNSAGQLFCGMCGTQLPTVPETPPQIPQTGPVMKASWSEPEADFGNDFYDEFGIDTAINAAAAASGHDVPERSWLQLRRDLPGFSADPEPEPARYRYRLYIGAVLAILLVALVYMAWRGTKAISGPAEQPIPAAVSPAQATPVSQQPGATGNVLPQVTPPASPRSTKKSEAKPRADQSAARQPAPLIVPPTASPAVASEPAGAGDFATAERYLNGSRGTARDPGEAVQWLWKAVGKGNLAATMALSDLYLRGDGVPKSCDARLLLGVAARKGGAAAAERLHNLQAFGCE